MRERSLATRTRGPSGTSRATAIGLCISCLGWCFLWGQAAAGLHLVPPLIPAALFFFGLMLPGLARARTIHGARS